MAQTVLVIEDEARISQLVARGLRAQGYAVRCVAEGRSGLAVLASSQVDLVLLDLMLPGMSGEEVLARLRQTDTQVPVIVLTAKDAVSDRVANLNAGADDYLIKPFSLAELIARIRARLRSPRQPASARIEVGRIQLDLLSRRAAFAESQVDLTAREFALLETFMRHPDQVLSEAQLLDLVWGYDFDPGSNVVEVYVGYLRRKVLADMIETIRGAGYRFRG